MNECFNINDNNFWKVSTLDANEPLKEDVVIELCRFHDELTRYLRDIQIEDVEKYVIMLDTTNDYIERYQKRLEDLTRTLPTGPWTLPTGPWTLPTGARTL